MREDSKRCGGTECNLRMGLTKIDQKNYSRCLSEKAHRELSPMRGSNPQP